MNDGIVIVKYHGGEAKYKLDESGIDGIFEYLEQFGDPVLESDYERLGSGLSPDSIDRINRFEGGASS